MIHLLDKEEDDDGGVASEDEKETQIITASEAASAITTLRDYYRQQNMPQAIRNQLDSLDTAVRAHRLTQPKSTCVITQFFQPRNV